MTHDISGNALARIGEPHGYRFDGDSVQINAELNFSDAALSATSQWALQLWSSTAAFQGSLAAGVKVAEVAVYPAAGTQNVVATVAAMPPAGTAEQNMALALVRWDGGLPVVVDLAAYPAAETFVQPRISGNVTCALADGMATLAVDSIDNPRAVDNLSGTLALEVWALPAPYAGGSWQGVPVASVILGVLGGGNQWSSCNFVVPAAAPEGPGVLTVMLREWGPAGYVTRDFCNLELDAPAKTEVEAPVATAKPAPKAAAKAAKAPAKAAKPATAKGVSVNSASEAELLAVKGLSATVAKAIIAARPYAALDDVCRAKGMGAKLLAKLRGQLVL